ncbi:MAG: thiamine biosynthesis protein ThiS [Nitrospiraceae bacterium]|nr:thiamine biosynthesis protein ThiS [Nitrospiraceae bacterium]|tara:strand:+ start:314 stop:547 length:234 start_codon:yes stop_codon:yes gene_type:complete
MDIVVNDEPCQVDEGLLVSGLLAQLGLSLRYLVVERNRVIIPHDAFDTTVLAADDRVEVIRFIGGGCDQYTPHNSRI